MLKLFFLILGAHLCGDVLIYSPALAGNKRSGPFLQRSKFILRHVLIHALLVWLWLWPFSFQLKLTASLYILIVHFLIDISRTYYEPILINKNDFHIFQRRDIFKWLTGKPINQETKTFLAKYLKIWLSINLLDQSLHFLSILIFVLIWGNPLAH